MILDWLPSFVTNGAFWTSFWPVPVFAALIGAALAVVPAKTQHNYLDRWFALAAVSSLGICIGFLTGESREPAVGAVIPTVLTLIGGTFIYVIGTQSAERQRAAGAAILSLAVSLFIGMNWGAITRQQFDDVRSSPLYKVKMEALEQQLRTIYGLPPASSAANDNTKK